MSGRYIVGVHNILTLIPSPDIAFTVIFTFPHVPAVVLSAHSHRHGLRCSCPISHMEITQLLVVLPLCA